MRLAMKSVGGILLVAGAMLSSGQQSQPAPSPEWRPNIAEDSSDAKCAFDYEHAYLDSTPSWSHALVHLDLRRLDPLSIAVVKTTDSPGFFVEFEGSNKEEFASLKEWMYRDGKANQFKSVSELQSFTCDGKDPKCKIVGEQRSKIGIKFSDLESAKRFARASLHAALLCGGTVSPF